MNYKNKSEILNCSHQWKDTKLIYNTVTDCAKCHVKKEDWDNQLSKEAKSEWSYKPNTKELPSKQTSFSDLIYQDLTHNDKDDDYTDWF